MASSGIAKGEPYNCDTEDTITLMTQWINLKSGNLGSAIYTASWVAPKSDVHSQQRFHYMGTTGEVQVDQAHRGYFCADDIHGYSSINPIYMKYTPDTEGLVV
jgi:D-galacturonate reductase